MTPVTSMILITPIIIAPITPITPIVITITIRTTHFKIFLLFGVSRWGHFVWSPTNPKHGIETPLAGKRIPRRSGCSNSELKSRLRSRDMKV